MSQPTPRARFPLLLLLAAVTAVPGLAARAQAGDAGATDATSRKIKIERRVQCEGEDCQEDDRRVIFIGDDGDTRVLGDSGHHWIDIDGDDIEIDLEDADLSRFVHLAHGRGGFLGVGLTDLTPELRRHFGVPEAAGVMVSKVLEDSPAQRAGLEAGDIITLVDEEDVASSAELAHSIGGREDGEAVTLEVWRDGRAERIGATIEVREGSGMPFAPRIHLRHHDGEHPLERRIEIRCGEDGEDCAAQLGELTAEIDCGSDECEVRVECADEGCTCTVNGDETDCADIPGVPGD